MLKNTVLPAVQDSLSLELDSLIEPLVSRWFGIDFTGDRLVFDRTDHKPETRRSNTVVVYVRALDFDGDFYICLDGYDFEGVVYIHALWSEIKDSPYLTTHRALDRGNNVCLQVSETGDDGQFCSWLAG